jgi:hypothetical protein
MINLLKIEKDADRGVGGVTYTITGRNDKGNLQSMPLIFSVQSGCVNPLVIRDLHGTIEREKAAGILVTLEEPSKPIIQECQTSRTIQMRFRQLRPAANRYGQRHSGQ